MCRGDLILRAWVRIVAGQQAVQHARKGVDVRRWCRQPLIAFWRDEAWRASSPAGLLGIGVAGKIQVNHMHMAITINQQVARRKVPVHHSLIVQRCDDVARIHDEPSPIRCGRRNRCRCVENRLGVGHKRHGHPGAWLVPRLNQKRETRVGLASLYQGDRRLGDLDRSPDRTVPRPARDSFIDSADPAPAQCTKEQPTPQRGADHRVFLNFGLHPTEQPIDPCPDFSITLTGDIKPSPPKRLRHRHRCDKDAADEVFLH